MRCYDGCPDSELQTFIDNHAKVRSDIVKLGFSVTYFPNGEFYQAFKDYRVASKEHSTLAGVLMELELK